MNKLNKKLFPVLLAGFLLVQPFSVLILANTVNAETCADECAYVGQHECSGTSGRTCGNYDSDCCYEWSSWQSCDNQCYFCGDGKCDSGCGETSSNCSQDCHSNNPPVADAGSDKNVYENQSVTLNGSGYDPEGYSLTYYWSCNGGSLSNRYTAQPTFNAPSVSYDRYYTCTLRVTDNDELTDSDNMRVLVKEKTYSAVSLDVSKSVKNLSRGDTKWYHSYRSADPSDRLLFQIKIESTGGTKARNVMVKDSLPDNIIYKGNLRIDNVYSSKNISTQAINIGDLSSGQTKIITFEAKVASKTKFSYGTTNLINTGLAYNTETSDSDTCKVIVTRKAVAGEVTDIPTGISNGILNSILFPLIITLTIVWIFRSKLIGFDKWSEKRKKEIERYRANKLLKRKIAQLRNQGIV